MNINASNQSLINTLLQQASKSNEKKRPTFEQVFAKLNARTARMDANKNPINNMLTNEQLFRYYIQETEPKLQMSNEAFSGEELFNPMKDSDPTKIYGSASTLTSDIAQASNPADILPNVGLDYPPDLRRPNKPISSKFASLMQQSRIPFSSSASSAPLKIATRIGDEVEVPTILPESDSEVLQVILGEADDNYKDALAINNRLSTIEYGIIPNEAQVLIKILFSDDYQDQSTYFMKQLIDGGGIGYENAISGLYDVFYQVRQNIPTNNFITNRIKDIVGSGVLQDEFDKSFNPNNVSQSEFIQNIADKVNKSAFFTVAEKTRMDKEINNIDSVPLADAVGQYVTNAEKAYFDLYGKTRVRIAIGDLFNDADTELRTNTDINSTVIDPQIVSRLGIFSSLFGGRSKPTPKPIKSIIESIDISPISSSAEAGSGEVRIDDVINRRRPRGVQEGDIRGPYATPKNIASSILGDIFEDAVAQSETRKRRGI